MLLFFAGCQSTPPVAPAEAAPPTEAERAAAEAQSVAVASLGKQAEVLAYGDLAQNGAEQVLAAVRFLKNRPDDTVKYGPSVIYETRAAVLQKTGEKWSQVFLCDEHLKNPKGYLGGMGSMLAGSWRMEYRRDPQAGLIMKFKSAVIVDAFNVHTGRRSAVENPTFEVRWNKIAKRYQSFDQSHERYLSEIPSLEPTESILK
jgi:hypothetical protein